MSNSNDSSPSSAKSNLRHFRFQKKALPKINSSESSVNSVPEAAEAQDGFPKNNIVSSDSEEEKSPNKNVVDEAALQVLQETFPLVNDIVLERSLIKAKGDVNGAKVCVREMVYTGGLNAFKKVVPAKPAINNKPVNVTNNINNKVNNVKANEVKVETPKVSQPVKRTFSETVNQQLSEKKNKKSKKDTKKLDEYDESGDSDDDGYNKQDKKVFDSDEDSDVEISDHMNMEQKGVYDFLSNAGLGELLCMPNCSQKKAEAIIEQRPFDGWKDMVEKFQEGKNLGTEVLNSAQEVLHTRQVVNQLMQKCSKIAVEMERAVSFGATNITTQPKLLCSNLKLAPYQMVGLNWLLILHHRGLNGILADEMGLGKTVQIIAFLAHLRETSGDDESHPNRGPHLIVVPSSTMDNWSNELARWCPDLKVHVYYGNLDERKLMRVQFSQQGIKEFDVILTTYNLVTSTPEERKMFKVLPFNYVIFDEAHMLKNMNTQRFENLMRVNAKHRILLTGTPLQNNLLELMSLLTFVMPDMFAKKKDYLKCLFTRNPKSIKTNGTSTEPQPRFEQEQVAKAKKIMQPFVLRRLKKDVLKDLPEKKEELVLCEMDERQRYNYDELVDIYVKKAQKNEAEEDGFKESGMAIMMDLRKLSNHPLLLRYLYDYDTIEKMAKILARDKNYKETNPEYVLQDLSEKSDYAIHTMCRDYNTIADFCLEDRYVLESGKFKKLDVMLPKLQQENRRVLIFSQFVIMLNILEEYLRIRGYKYLRLDGSTQVTIRQDLIDTFNQDPSIFIFMLSTRAGGLGINLTAADTVIIHDIDFNPYNDKQAEDRCHRVGQDKPVTVMRFISKDSIEENIYQTALEKLSLEREISSEDNEQSEVKSVARLLKKVLGLEGIKLSPQKKPT